MGSGEDVVGAFELEQADGLVGLGEDVEGVLGEDDVVFGAVDEEPGDLDHGGAGHEGFELAEVVHVGLGERTGFVIPHVAFIRDDGAEFAFGEVFGGDHAGEGDEELDAFVFTGADDADGAAHAVADVADVPALEGIQHGAEVGDFLGDVGVGELAFGGAVAGEGNAEGIEAGFFQAFGEGDDEGAVFVTRDTMTENHDALRAGGALVEGVVDAFAVLVADFAEHKFDKFPVDINVPG